MSTIKIKLINKKFKKNRKKILFINKLQILILQWLGFMPNLTVEEFMKQYKKNT